MATASFPGMHNTGPIHNFVRAKTSIYGNNIYYLGTCEVTPQVVRKKFTAPSFNEIKGVALPMQKHEGLEAHDISLLLNRFSNTAWTVMLAAGGAFGILGAEVGTWSRWAVGAPVFGLRTFELWMVFENALNPNVQTDVEIGWYYPQVELVNHDLAAAGPTAEKVLMQLSAEPRWVPQANSQQITGNERGWELYTNDPLFFPDEVLIPQ